MPFTPESRDWPADRAVLLVHGIGNAGPGDYESLRVQLAGVLGGHGAPYALYVFYYDLVNDWFAAKMQLETGIARVIAAVRSQLDATALGNVVADFVGDLLWPVLLLDARDAVRTALLSQIQQVVLDGKRAGVERPFQRLSIVAHSLGCFHTFEALHAAAGSVTQGIAPGTDGVRFDNVVYMASPVQLIRHVAGKLGALVPRRGALATLADAGLAAPAERIITGEVVPSARRTVSVAGNLDPVGGYYFRRRLDWAYTALPGQESLVDDQTFVDIHEADLQAILQQALRDHETPRILPNNPHDWGAYVSRHADDLRRWLTDLPEIA